MFGEYGESEEGLANKTLCSIFVIRRKHPLFSNIMLWSLLHQISISAFLAFNWICEHLVRSKILLRIVPIMVNIFFTSTHQEKNPFHVSAMKVQLWKAKAALMVTNRTSLVSLPENHSYINLSRKKIDFFYRIWAEKNRFLLTKIWRIIMKLFSMVWTLVHTLQGTWTHIPKHFYWPDFADCTNPNSYTNKTIQVVALTVMLNTVQISTSTFRFSRKFRNRRPLIKKLWGKLGERVYQ